MPSHLVFSPKLSMQHSRGIEGDGTGREHRFEWPRGTSDNTNFVRRIGWLSWRSDGRGVLRFYNQPVTMKQNAANREPAGGSILQKGKFCAPANETNQWASMERCSLGYRPAPEMMANWVCQRGDWWEEVYLQPHLQNRAAGAKFAAGSGDAQYPTGWFSVTSG